MHPHMVFDIDECEQYSSLPNKTTIVMTTCQSPMNVFMWSVFSIFTNSKQDDFFEHINISVNGCDSRTGDPSLQDKKQAFLEDIRNTKWRSYDGKVKDMPLTVIRTWSRVGADQAVEMGVVWVHTDSYIIMHDDVLLVKRGWEDEIKPVLYSDPKLAVLYGKPLVQGSLCESEFNGGLKLNYPHMNGYFLACRKPAIVKSGVRWAGYHFQKDFSVDQREINKEFNSQLPEGKEYNCISQDFGAWMLYRLRKNGYNMLPIERGLTHHLGSMSWGGADDPGRFERVHPYVENLEKELQRNPEWWSIYNKYKT